VPYDTVASVAPALPDCQSLVTDDELSITSTDTGSVQLTQQVPYDTVASVAPALPDHQPLVTDDELSITSTDTGSVQRTQQVPYDTVASVAPALPSPRHVKPTVGGTRGLYCHKCTVTLR